MRSTIATALVALGATLALAGCKQEAAPAGPKSMAEVAKEAAGLPKPLPGLYRTTVDVISVDAPGMPPQMAERMKEAMSRQSADSKFCLSSADAEKGYEERVKRLAGQPDCAFDRYAATGGKLDAQLTCKGEQGTKSVLTMTGTMTPGGSDVTMSMDQSGSQMPGGSMKMTVQVKSERVGDCPN